MKSKRKMEYTPPCFSKKPIQLPHLMAEYDCRNCPHEVDCTVKTHRAIEGAHDKAAYVKKLVDGHWKYVESVIRNEYDAEGAQFGSGIDLDAYCRRVGHHFKTAMIHGFGHGVEWADQGRTPNG